MSIIRFATLLAVTGITALGQVPNGSFESATAGSTVMPTGWTSSVTSGGSATRIYPYLSCVSDTGFPSNGTKWVRLTSSVMGTPTAFTSTSRIESTFSTGTSGSVLKMDVAFMTGEGVGNTSYNDFMVVTVTVGASTQTLYTATTAASAFPQTSMCNSMPSTGKISLSQNLAVMFPSLTSTTPITLRAYVANGGDTAVASYGYVDNVTLSSTVVIPPFTLTFTQPGTPGFWVMKTYGPGLPGAEVYNLVALNLSVPTGSGPLFGIAFDAMVLDEVMSPLGTIPWHVLLDATGTFQIGPFAIPPGLSIDYIAIAIVGGSIAQVTPASSITF